MISWVYVISISLGLNFVPAKRAYLLLDPFALAQQSASNSELEGQNSAQTTASLLGCFSRESWSHNTLAVVMAELWNSLLGVSLRTPVLAWDALAINISWL